MNELILEEKIMKKAKILVDVNYSIIKINGETSLYIDNSGYIPNIGISNVPKNKDVSAVLFYESASQPFPRRILIESQNFIFTR